ALRRPAPVAGGPGAGAAMSAGLRPGELGAPRGASAGRGFWAWYSPPAPRARLELLRVAIGGYALVYLVSRGVHLTAVVNLPEASFAPVGVVRWLAAPLAAGWV